MKSSSRAGAGSSNSFMLYTGMATPDQDALEKRMTKLGIREDDLEEDFVRGSGPGGQKINKTSSTVVLRHVPTGVEVRCQKERSQVMNRHWARVELCDRLETALKDARLAVQNEREKVRRQNRPRPRGVKRKILQGKRERGEVKRNRGRVKDD
ncbi:peptide chain release factor-like protein [Brevifollis gellanilyticus]|nr:peptide chain release factor-like protein [Brevifollis gellanilyticus]